MALHVKGKRNCVSRLFAGLMFLPHKFLQDTGDHSMEDVSRHYYD